MRNRFTKDEAKKGIFKSDVTLKEIEEYLNLYPDLIKENDESGFTILHYAALYSDLKICKFLLQKGADVNAKNNSNHTPLDLVPDDKTQNSEITRTFLQNAQLEIEKENLREARQKFGSRNRKSVEFMTQEEIRNETMDIFFWQLTDRASNHEDRTFILEKIKASAASYANIIFETWNNDEERSDSLPSLERAADLEDFDLTNILLDGGANVSFWYTEPGEDDEQLNETHNRINQLHQEHYIRSQTIAEKLQAVIDGKDRTGCEKEIQELIKKGFDRNYSNDVTEVIPLSALAAQAGFINLIEPLRNHEQIREGYTALHIAVQSNNSGAVEELLKTEGVIVNARTTKNLTPLHFVSPNPRIVKALIEAGATVTKEDIQWVRDFCDEGDTEEEQTQKLVIEAAQKRIDGKLLDALNYYSNQFIFFSDTTLFFEEDGNATLRENDEDGSSNLGGNIVGSYVVDRTKIPPTITEKDTKESLDQAMLLQMIQEMEIDKIHQNSAPFTNSLDRALGNNYNNAYGQIDNAQFHAETKGAMHYNSESDLIAESEAAKKIAEAFLKFQSGEITEKEKNKIVDEADLTKEEETNFLKTQALAEMAIMQQDKVMDNKLARALKKLEDINNNDEQSVWNNTLTTVDRRILVEFYNAHNRGAEIVLDPDCFRKNDGAQSSSESEIEKIINWNVGQANQEERKDITARRIAAAEADNKRLYGKESEIAKGVKEFREDPDSTVTNPIAIKLRERLRGGIGDE